MSPQGMVTLYAADLPELVDLASTWKAKTLESWRQTASQAFRPCIARPFSYGFTLADLHSYDASPRGLLDGASCSRDRRQICRFLLGYTDLGRTHAHYDRRFIFNINEIDDRVKRCCAFCWHTKHSTVQESENHVFICPQHSASRARLLYDTNLDLMNVVHPLVALTRMANRDRSAARRVASFTVSVLSTRRAWIKRLLANFG